MAIPLPDRPAGPWARTPQSFLGMRMDAPPEWVDSDGSEDVDDDSSTESAAAAMESAAAAENDDDDSIQAAPGSASAAPGAVAGGAQSWLDAMDD